MSKPPTQRFFQSFFSINTTFVPDSQEQSGASIFFKYFHPENCVDRFADNAADGVDVIIPVIHTNELWRANLLSIYREIPVRRLLLGDGGCIDNTLTVAKEFPRVEVFDHTKYTSLGYSIRKLIEEVSSEWFVYLHSDVYLPPGWFGVMAKHRDTYDWFECRQHITILADYPLSYEGINRPFSGSQMGRKAALQEVVKTIDDDYLYRNEDIIITDLLEKKGFRYGRVDETYHYHQLMYKKSRWHRKISNVDIAVAKSPEEELREATTQIKGLIKYTQPERYRIREVQFKINVLDGLGKLQLEDLRKFTRETNPSWLRYVRRRALWKLTLANLGLWAQRKLIK